MILSIFLNISLSMIQIIGTLDINATGIHEFRGILSEIESGEWKSSKVSLDEYKASAENQFKKNERISIRISEFDLKSIQKRAISEGMPYQTLITSLIHKYVTGKLLEVK
jgi:predicted DNA binding CopG/RHH family protein